MQILIYHKPLLTYTRICNHNRLTLTHSLIHACTMHHHSCAYTYTYRHALAYSIYKMFLCFLYSSCLYIYILFSASALVAVQCGYHILEHIPCFAVIHGHPNGLVALCATKADDNVVVIVARGLSYKYNCSVALHSHFVCLPQQVQRGRRRRKNG